MWLILAIFILTLLYYAMRKQLSYWKKRGVPGPSPLPLVGNMGKGFIGATSMGELMNNIYKKHEGHPFVGIYVGGSPSLLIRDTDFIKNVIVKNFKCFEDNNIFVDKETDPLFGRNPFVLKGDEWRKSRSQLSPCFTSVKMKSIYQFIEEGSKTMVKFVENQKEATNSTGMEAKELCTKFTIDNVGICAFGLEAKCFENPNSEFRSLARQFISPDSWTGFKFLLMTLFPKLTSILSLKFVPKECEDRLLEIVKETIRYRKENNIERNDFFDYICKLPATNTTEIDITAHAASFFADGFETSSQVMSFLLFELAMNPEVQTKLRNEIKDSFENNNKQFSYESISNMTYLDACLSESLRKYPAIFFLSKTCTERYTYTPSNPDYKNITVTVEPGTEIVLPIGGLHMDPKYFESPEKYMPERFLDKENINRYTYLPFGEGPRACLGQRFGVLQIKVGVVYLVHNFELKLNQKTQLPLTYDPWYFLLSPKGGLWLNFHKIKA